MSENTDYDKVCREIARIAAALGIVDYSGDTSEIFDAIIIKDEKHQALAGENAVMKQIIDSVTDLDNEPKYHSKGMACGLEDRGITDRYDAMQHGWECAMERVYGEVIPCDEELDFTATTQALNEIKAQGVEEYGNLTIRIGQDENCEEVIYAGKQALLFAASLRGE
ncbi:hypothetical protein J8Z86_08430 [Yersinia enterocolitica]|uniref:hypothetical protein n=1 Tax=Yersinia enterocolitica TaxID=630 RepID=UPI001C8D272D|nr:hypothetical protein [Yersinia enterocolitica]MBX9496102.1 hypothetical protein [Yersinia enterocolitica]